MKKQGKTPCFFVLIKKLSFLERIQLIFRFIKYYLKSKTLYKVHSPFVFEFCEEVLDDKKIFYGYEKLEQLRKELFRDNRVIEVTDFGAGSHVTKSNKRAISSIAKSAVSPAHQSKMLFKIVNHFQPNTMLEFGTSLGLTAAYQALPNPNSQFISLEGCPNISSVAKKNWEKLNINNINILTGEFNGTIPKALDTLGELDYVFFDGNHKKEPTLEYFEKCLKNSNANSVFIFDDIHWSEGMEAAWNEIKIHPSVSISIDLFFMGIIFFRKENKEQEHFTLIPARFKFWQKYF